MAKAICDGCGKSTIRPIPYEVKHAMDPKHNGTRQYCPSCARQIGSPGAPAIKPSDHAYTGRKTNGY